MGSIYIINNTMSYLSVALVHDIYTHSSTVIVLSPAIWISLIHLSVDLQLLTYYYYSAIIITKEIIPVFLSNALCLIESLKFHSTFTAQPPPYIINITDMMININ